MIIDQELFRSIKRKTKRTPYVKSKYFNKEKDESLHRFLGSTKDRELFVVQIKENKKTDRKNFISIYPL